MARLTERLSRLEASIVDVPVGEHFPCLSAVATSDAQAFGLALEDGFWPNLTERPEVAAMLECDSLTAEQGAVLGVVSREVMANEQPRGAGWANMRIAR